MPEELRYMEKLPGLGYQDNVSEYLGKAITSVKGTAVPLCSVRLQDFLRLCLQEALQDLLRSGST